MNNKLTFCLLHIAEISKMLGVTKMTIYRIVRDNEFPKPIKISKRARGWRSDEVEE